jgi:hypothetical protein
MSSLTRTMKMFHVLTTTGEKIGADDNFWTSLANSRIAFEIIVGIPPHIAIMKKRKILFNTPVYDRTADLKKWISSLDKNANSLLDIEPNEKFLKKLINRIASMRISEWELTTLPHSTLVEENGNIIFRPNSLENTIDHLVRDIKTIIAQRKFIKTILSFQD